MEAGAVTDFPQSYHPGIRVRGDSTGQSTSMEDRIP